MTRTVTCRACSNVVGEDVIEADGSLICPVCFCTLDDLDLVSGVVFDEDGAQGVLVGADDDGTGARASRTAIFS
jgi:hypothetical protein